MFLNLLVFFAGIFIIYISLDRLGVFGKNATDTEMGE